MHTYIHVGPLLESRPLRLRIFESTRITYAVHPRAKESTDYPAWVNAGSFVSLALLAAGIVAAFFDTRAAAALVALAFAGIWVFGTAAERVGRG